METRKLCADGKYYTKDEYVKEVMNSVKTLEQSKEYQEAVKIMADTIAQKVDETVLEKIAAQLAAEGFDYATAIATQAEINAGAACGQLAIVEE